MPKYRILPWIDVNKLNKKALSRSHKAITFLEENPEMIDWDSFSLNQAGFHIIKDNLDKIDWNLLSSNCSAIPILKENVDKINWDNFLRNGSIDASYVIRDNKDKIKDWNNLCWNRNDWINDIFDEDIMKILAHWDICSLEGNPCAIPTLEKYEKYMKWNCISKNPNAIHMLKKRPEEINLYELLLNPNPEALHFFEKYILPKPFDTFDLSRSKIMIPFLKKNREYINDNICKNDEPEAVELIEYFIDEHAKKFDEFYWWSELSQNVSAICIMKKNIEHIDWSEFCYLEEAIPIIEEHLDKVNWTILSSNPGAMHILKNNQDKIDWSRLSENDGIYEEMVE
jgi:hypothetical protein